MDDCNLEGAEVLSITLDQAHLYFEIVVRTSENATFKLSAWSPTGAPLEVSIGALQVQAFRTDLENRPTLGELESVSMAGNVLALAGDFGDVVIRGTRTSIEQLT